MPNDATFYVADNNGKLLPFALPARVFTLDGRPVPIATADQAGSCMTVNFDGSKSYDPDGGPLKHVWRFGDGASAPGVSAIHEYTVEGRIEAILEVTDSAPQLGNGAPVSLMVFVKKPPIARSARRLLVAAGEENKFDGSPSSASQWSIARHDWDSGDGARLSGDVVSHAFAEPGTYSVTHTVTDNSGHPCNTASEQFLVRVNAEPVAEAGANQRVSIGEGVVFDAGQSADSDGALVDYQWDFGDGAKATGAVVRHKYAKPATYPVRLAVRDDSDVANSGAADQLTVIVNDPPVADASTDKTGAIMEVLAFDASGSADRDGDLIAYEWDFGDGATGTGESTTHAYAKSGTYTVGLTVTDDSTTGSSKAQDSLSVRVNQPPVADAGSDQLVTASLVQLDGSASGDADDQVAKYDWDFGDGTSGSGPTPSHVYAKPGTYDIHLTVTDASGTIRSSAGDTVEVVVNAVPIADAGPDLIGTPGETLVFQGSRSLDSDGSVAEYFWDFRDGATAAGKVVEHAFEKPGTYAVRLQIRDNTGQDDAVDYAETQVFINKPPVADAGADVLAVGGDEIKFSAAQSFDSDGEIVSYRWDFGDMEEPVMGDEIARTFTEPGIYSVQLTVTDDSGADNSLATDSVRIAINHAPAADAGPDIVDSQSTITFDASRSVDADGDAMSYAWDFGDGSTATGPIAVHTYAEGGSFPVVLTVNDGTKLKNAVTRDAISVTINRPPVAVAGKNERVCTGDIVVLDGSASFDPEGGALRYTWDLGDGSTSEIINPTKSYTKGGTYPVTLIVKDDTGLPNSTSTSQIAVRVDQGPIAKVDDIASHEALVEQVTEAAEAHYRRREGEMGGEMFHRLERWIILGLEWEGGGFRGINQLWREHLLNMDHLKEGIGLRGYGQRDPLTEYKKEAFDMFQEMIGSLKETAVEELFKVRMTQEDAPTSRVAQRAAPEWQESRGGDLDTAPGRPVTARPEPRTADGQKVGRNDPCHCGSGKKYKKCCLLKGA